MVFPQHKYDTFRHYVHRDYAESSHHGLRGIVNGRWQFSTPTESTPLDRSPKKLLLVITSATPTAVPNLVQIRPRGATGQMGEI